MVVSVIVTPFRDVSMFNLFLTVQWECFRDGRRRSRSISMMAKLKS